MRWISARSLSPACWGLLALVTALAAWGDTVTARCDIYPVTSQRPVSTQPCTFSQRQGYITIQREDGRIHELSPLETGVGNFRDERGAPVYRNSGLGEAGLIFRFPDQKLYVYWDPALPGQ